MASLWTSAVENATTTNGRVRCNHGAGSAQIVLEVYDKTGNSLYQKFISAD